MAMRAEYPVSDLRAAVEALRESEWRECDGACHDRTLAAVLALIDAHQCYDVDALAKAFMEEDTPGRRGDRRYERAHRQHAAAIIARLHEA